MHFRRPANSLFIGGLILLTPGVLGLYAQEQLPRGLPASRPIETIQVRELNNELLRIHGEMQRSAPEQWAALREEAAPVLQQRFAALRELVQQNPREALTYAFSPELLADLSAKFPQFASHLEGHGTWQGSVERWVFDSADLKSSRTVLIMKVGQETFEIHFAEREPAGLKSGGVLEVTGVQVGYLLAASTGTVNDSRPTIATTASHRNSLPLAHPRITTMATTFSGPACSTTGVQNIAVLLATFPGVTPPSTVTPQSVYDAFFGTTGHSLDGFWREASYGKTSAAGNVYGYYTLDRSYSCGEASLMRDAAIAMATADGANFQNYTRVFVVYPNVGCTAGFSTVGCTTLNSPSGPFNASSSYIEVDYVGGDQGVQLATHEGGHALGLQHSGTMDFGLETLGPLGATGTVNEFGDYWSTMGSQALGIYPSQQKAEILNWLDPGANFQVVQSSGTWSLQPLETSPAGLQALKIQRGTGNNAWLWVEYRQPIGNYDSTLMAQPFAGALIHYEDPTTGAFTHLLNFRPDGAWNTWWYPALAAGQTWTDPYTNLSLSVPNATTSGLTVNVNYGAVPCTPTNPTVTVTPPDPTIPPGLYVNYSVLVTNNAAAGCPASTFNLSSSQPSGWSGTLSSKAVTLSPGQIGAVVLTETAPANAAPGTYALKAIAANAVNSSYAGSGTANVTVMSTSTTTVTVSVPSTSYPRKGTVSVTATVLKGGSPVSGASVTFNMTMPNGTKVSQSATTGRRGTAAWSYRLSANSLTGTYSANALATLSSSGAASTQAITSNTVTFSVQ